MNDESRAEAYVKMHGDELQKKYCPDGSGIGIGLKQVDGVITDQIAIIFFVKKKEPDDAFPASKCKIPSKIAGIPTDVVEIIGSFKPL